MSLVKVGGQRCALRNPIDYQLVFYLQRSLSAHYPQYLHESFVIRRVKIYFFNPPIENQPCLLNFKVYIIGYGSRINVSVFVTDDSLMIGLESIFRVINGLLIYGSVVTCSFYVDE